jgi:hypothetical protein
MKPRVSDKRTTRVVLCKQMLCEVCARRMRLDCLQREQFNHLIAEHDRETKCVGIVATANKKRAIRVDEISQSILQNEASAIKRKSNRVRVKCQGGSNARPKTRGKRNGREDTEIKAGIEAYSLQHLVEKFHHGRNQSRVSGLVPFGTYE